LLPELRVLTLSLQRVLKNVVCVLLERKFSLVHFFNYFKLAINNYVDVACRLPFLKEVRATYFWGLFELVDHRLQLRLSYRFELRQRLQKCDFLVLRPLFNYLL
jgi:hypothetical protein